MKAVFYTQLFSDTGLGIGAKMIYSQLIFRAVVYNNESFDTEGEFNIDRAKVFEGDWCGLEHVKVSQVAKDLNIDPKTVSRTIKKLKESGRIDENNNIYIPDNILTSYIELLSDEWLSGWDLIVYSFIWNRTRKFKYIDTYRTKLAEFFCISETHLSNILLSLRNSGHIERIIEGKHWKISRK